MHVGCVTAKKETSFWVPLVLSKLRSFQCFLYCILELEYVEIIFALSKMGHLL
jgi:hypothetical protein